MIVPKTGNLIRNLYAMNPVAPSGVWWYLVVFIGVFIDVTLPRTVRIGKVDFHTRRLDQALLRLNASQNMAEATERELGTGNSGHPKLPEATFSNDG